MSEEGSFGLSAAERMFGLLVLVIGIIMMYYTATSTQVLASFTGLFGFLNAILIVLGLVLVTAKTE